MGRLGVKKNARQKGNISGIFFLGGGRSHPIFVVFQSPFNYTPFENGWVGGDSRRSEFSRILHACTLSAHTPAAIFPIFIPTLSPQKNPLKKSLPILSFLTLELCTGNPPSWWRANLLCLFPLPPPPLLSLRKKRQSKRRRRPTNPPFFPSFHPGGGAKTF